MALAFKAGLEIHQQLDTAKLFCGCPGYLRQDVGTQLVTRQLHAIAGEMGEVDAAVKHEAGKEKTFVYEGYPDTTCLVEFDEAPPQLISSTALDEALRVALLLHCEVYQHTQIMRKLVIDGSNTSGFQRTVLLARKGYVETSFGKVPIDTVCLEEDSARLISEKDASAVRYRLDRLGIPLVEIATAPVLTSPAQVKETALKLGEILRACNVKRGIGTIRQDVNMSSPGHPRVEIKGFQDIAMMEPTILTELERQNNEKKGEEHVRQALPDGTTKFLRPMPGKARMYPETDLPLLYIPKEKLDALKQSLPRLQADIKQDLLKQGLSSDLITLVLEGKVALYTTLVKRHALSPVLIAKLITLWTNEAGTKNKKTADECAQLLSEEVYDAILERVASGTLAEGQVKGVVHKLVQGVPLAQALQVEKQDDDTLAHAIRALLVEKPGLRANAYMGLLIGKLGAHIDKAQAMKLLQELVP
jgi:Glu-tRNA(Gln) amidotransferase subunit E-like FAD-binding protein